MQIDGIDNSKKRSLKNTEKPDDRKTALDVAKEVKGFIKTEYPSMADSHAMRLAVLLTKVQTKDLI